MDWVIKSLLQDHSHILQIVFCKYKVKLSYFMLEVMHVIRKKGLPIPTGKKVKSIYTLENLFSDVHKRFCEYEVKTK